jgi:UDP-N-acetyl-D-galactosamine dehydrogenase
VPTPIDKFNKPDLRPLLSATLAVANVLKAGDYVVYESTVYPGCTNEECIPLLERVSGMRVRRDFKVGYSPERINPGDAEHSLHKTIKIVSACDGESLDTVARIYESVVEAGVHKAPEIRVAEAAKIIENTQRDVNIALMNELSIIFNRMGLNTFDVIKAAATKWNFVPYTPGLVGGHCIGVDPYYMVHKASELKYHPQMIASGRFVNDSMGGYVAKQTVKKLLSNDLPLLRARVLIMGFTYKENVSDIRNTKVADIVKELQSFRVAVDVVDPNADPHAVEEEYNIKLLSKPAGKYHAIIMAVPHKEYQAMSETDLKTLVDPKGLIVDIRGTFRDTIKDLRYWSL